MSHPGQARDVHPHRTSSGLGGTVARRRTPVPRRATVPFTVRYLAAGVLALALLATAACGGSGHRTSGSSSPSPSSGLTATRWWSNAAASAGSTIAPGDPGAAAADLHASRSGYCAMLSQTLAAGKSILPGATATDPALLTSTEAFVDEIGRIAPSDVAGQWKLVGTALVSFVRSTGKSLGTAAPSQDRLSAAVKTITADAKTNCHLDLTTKP